jgi:hypothetical protein
VQRFGQRTKEGQMSWNHWSKACVAGCGLAMALSVTACNRDEAAEVDRDTDRLATDTRTPQGHEGAPITVTGCLQRGSGMNNFILTQVNSPAESPVATSGKADDAVQREQMRGAKHAYALEGDDDDALRNLVGKQVRVTGMIAESSALRREISKPRDTTGSRDSLDIDSGDLAKVDVQGIVQVADVCGDAK